MAKTTVSKQEAPKDFQEIGSTGLQRSGSRGLVYEEFLPQLSDSKGRKIFREMRDNDATVSAMLFAIEMLLRKVEWRVEGDDEELAEFVQSCLDDMSTSWSDTLAEILSFLTYGWAWCEVVYKRRVGPDQSNPSKRSRFNDGKIGWRKLPLRSQDTLQEWVFDEEGGVQAMVQVAPPTYQEVTIPINRSLLFRTGIHKGNPEGRSMLRGAYRAWYFKKRTEEIEGIGVERDLAGLPVIKRSAEIATKYDAELKKILRNVRRDEQEGLLLPLAYDSEGREMLTFSLMSSAGQRQLDVDKIIQRYDKRIAMTCMADFILLGQQSVGSFALADNKTELFAVALGAILNSIADVMNRHAIPRLLGVNGLIPKDVEDMPKLVPGDIESPDLGKLGAFITALAGAGAALFPDDELEAHLRSLADLPKKSEETIRAQQEEQQKLKVEAQQKLMRTPIKQEKQEEPPAIKQNQKPPKPQQQQGEEEEIKE